MDYNKILVPHDGSEMSDTALRHAIYLCKFLKAELTIISIIDQDVIPPSILLSFIRKEEEGGLQKSKEDIQKTFEDAIKKMLENKIEQFNHDLHISYKVLAGKPADEIIKFSEESDIDLIVMASSRILSPVRIIGSTARKVLDSTRKPVLMIHE